MNEVFADSGYWIAILVTGDQHRESAYRAVASLESARIVTTEMVLTEVFATISRRGRESRLLAMVLLDDLKNDPNVTIIRKLMSSLTQPRNSLRDEWINATA